MAHSLSAKKRIRQNEKRRMLNRGRRAVLRKRIRACNEAIVKGDGEAAESSLRDACTLLNREANRGLIHRNAAARRKSRLARRLNALKGKRSAT